MTKSKTCHGAKWVNESKVVIVENRVKLIRIKVYYRKDSPNEGKYTDYISAVEALTAFSKI